MAFLNSRVLLAVTPFKLKIPTANGAVFQVSAVGLASVPNATCTAPPFALKPAVPPPVICIFPVAAPPVRSRLAPVSKTPPLIVSRLPAFNPTPSFARSTPPLIVTAPVPVLTPLRISVPELNVVCPP